MPDLKSKLNERIVAALKADPRIVCSYADANKHPGSSLQYLESLGLTKSDLIRLERNGLAVRGRTPNGSLVEVNKKFMRNFKDGSRVRWILLDRSSDHASADPVKNTQST